MLAQSGESPVQEPPMQSFFQQESGAVTVDWTVLAAAIVGLGVATVAAVRTGVVSLGTDIDASLSSASVVALGALGDDGLGFSYERLYASDSLWGSWMSSFSGWPDSTLLNMYDFYSTNAATYITNGNMTNAAYYIDLAYAMQQTLLTRDVSVPDNGAVLETLTNQYLQAAG